MRMSQSGTPDLAVTMPKYRPPGIATSLGATDPMPAAPLA